MSTVAHSTTNDIVVRLRFRHIPDADTCVCHDIVQRLMTTTKAHSQERKEAQYHFDPESNYSPGQRDTSLGLVVNNVQVHQVVAYCCPRPPYQERLIEEHREPPDHDECNSSRLNVLEKENDRDEEHRKNHEGDGVNANRVEATRKRRV